MHVLSLQEAWQGRDVGSVGDVMAQIRADRLTWVRAGGVADDALEALGEAFGLHPLAVEDVRAERQRPKVEDYPDMTFVVLRVPRREAELAWQQVGIFLGADYVVTASVEPIHQLDLLQERLLQRGMPDGRETASHLFYLIVDALVDAWFPFTDGLEDDIENLEDQAGDSPDQETLAEIRDMKRLVSRVRKVSLPLREATLSLERSEHPHLDDATRIYLRDVSDHMVRIQERLEHVKEMALIAQETWNATLANQQNQVMKRLTVVAALLLVPGLVAGLGGMNFEHGFPDWPYWWVTAGIIGFPVVGLAVAWGRGWL